MSGLFERLKKQPDPHGLLARMGTQRLRKHRRQASIHGSHEAVLAKVHAHLLWSARQLRESGGGAPNEYRNRGLAYRNAAVLVKKAINMLRDSYQ